jgi:hypothetical protein
MSDRRSDKRSLLSPEVIERSLSPPENCVMHQYPDGNWGWQFDPVKFRRLRKARKQSVGLDQRSREELTTNGGDS